MRLVASTLDDLLLEVYRRLLEKTDKVVPTKGAMSEIVGAHLLLRNPRARLSRTASRNLLFGHLGELLWYLSGKNLSEIITYYIPQYPIKNEEDSKVIRAAYGPRLVPRHGSNFSWVIQTLRDKPASRRAVLVLYDQRDYGSHSEVPCTCTLQFLLRGHKLQLIAHMRSNDVFKGLPGDIFAFTMIQELVARALGVDVGTYQHMVGSLHLYEEDRGRAQNFVSECWQQKRPMPPMPTDDQCPAVLAVLRAEVLIRRGVETPKLPKLETYWSDIVLLLRIYAALRSKSLAAVRRLRSEMYSESFHVYIDSKRRRLEREVESQVFVSQEELDFSDGSDASEEEKIESA